MIVMSNTDSLFHSRSQIDDRVPIWYFQTDAIRKCQKLMSCALTLK